VNRDRRLGRGLAALLGDNPEQNTDTTNSGTRAVRPASEQGDGEGGSPREVHGGAAGDASAAGEAAELMLFIDEIAENPFQPRREFGEAEIASLAESLREHQLLQPILVRRHGDKWQLISGERRLRAARRAGWKKIPARIREADDRLVAELAIVENLQRKDLNAIEKALSFQRYLREHKCTQDDLGKRIKVDRSTIANLMRLLELPADIQTAVQEDRLSAGHARALLPLGDAQQQMLVCEKIYREQLNVRAVEKLVQEIVEREDGVIPMSSDSVPKGKNRRRTRNDQIASLEQDYRRLLGTKVEIKATSTGRGRMVIHFRNADEFERIRALILSGGDPGRLKATGSS
jgi:ParB family transcriptional regulator, chromosome partitioning protein